jgi:hypothetical protein
METNPSPTADQPKLRWFRLTPDRIVVALLVVEGFLLLSEWFRWFAFNRQTWTVLIALAAVGLALVVMFLWFVMALLFRWRFQYGIRSLMLLTVGVAVACSWVAVEMRNERRQKAAAEAIEKMGGGVESEATWLGRLLRDRSLVTATKMFHQTNATDAELAHLEGTPHLQWLWLNCSPITDAGVPDLLQELIREDDFARIEQHGEALARPLRVPDHAAPLVPLRAGRFHRRPNRLLGGVELVVARDDLDDPVVVLVVLEGDEVPQQLEHSPPSLGSYPRGSRA